MFNRNIHAAPASTAYHPEMHASGLRPLSVNVWLTVN